MEKAWYRLLIEVAEKVDGCSANFWYGRNRQHPGEVTGTSSVIDLLIYTGTAGINSEDDALNVLIYRCTCGEEAAAGKGR